MKRKFFSMFALSVCLTFSTLALSSNRAAAQDRQIDIRIKVKSGDEKQEKPKVVGKAPFAGKRASVDVAILLDTSNSMDGLISQAKSQLWNIVQQFANAKKQGQTPMLRVSVFEYGNTSLPASEGYIRQVVALTDDLDKVSEALFSLKTNGGDEYCGQVIGECIKRLDWSKETNGYKAIFIAGNEPFTQGSVDYRESCKQAIEAGIVVNTIHCGHRNAGIQGMWADGAKIAEGEFMNINQDKKVVHIKCPQDKIIIELNGKLNKTYLWYGKKEVRKYYLENQIKQDSNAGKGSQAQLVQRANAKISGVYYNGGRDLCDTFCKDKDILTKVKVEELPEFMQKMSEQERKAHVEKMVAERNKIKKELAKVNREREAYLTKERKKLAEKKGEKTLGDAVILSVQKQLKSNGFEMKK